MTFQLPLRRRGYSLYCCSARSVSSRSTQCTLFIEGPLLHVHYVHSLHTHTHARTHKHTQVFHLCTWTTQCTHALNNTCAHPYMHARSRWLWGVAVVTVWSGTRALVGGYSQHLYGAINQSEGSTLCPREEGGWKQEASEKKKKRERKSGGWWCCLSPKHYIIT